MKEIIEQVLNLQKQVDGLVKPEVGRWIAWTPTVVQSAAVTVTVTAALYKLKEDLMVVHASLAITSAGTITNAIVVNGIPFGSAIISDFPIGHGIIVDSGTQLYVVEVVANTATSWRFFSNAAGGNYVGITPNFALASGDSIKFTCTYKI